MPELFFRVLFSAVAIPVTLLIILNGGFIFKIFIALFLIGGSIEFYLLTKERGRPIILPSVIIGILLFCLRSTTDVIADAPSASWHFYKYFFPVMWTATFLVMVLEVFRADTQYAIERAGGTFLAIFYLGFLGSYLLIIPERTAVIHLNDTSTVIAKVKGSGLVMLLFAVWASDTFAYFGGRLFGKKLLLPKLSPKKTVVGMFCALLGGVVGMLVGRTLFKPAFPAVTGAICIGVAIGIFGQIGDLFESLIKRSCGVKDSSNLFPGHGGILDRIDALLFCAPVYYYMLYSFK